MLNENNWPHLTFKRSKCEELRRGKWWTINLHLFTHSSNLTKYKHFSFKTVPVTGRQLSPIHYNVPIASTKHCDPSRIIIIINEQYRLDFKTHGNCSLIEGFIYRDLNTLIEIIGNTPSLSGQNAFLNSNQAIWNTWKTKTRPIVNAFTLRNLCRFVRLAF